MTGNQRIGFQSHLMFEGIPLWTCLALLNGGKLNSLLSGATFCDRERITLSEVGFKTVDERKVNGGILKNRNGACFNEISNAFRFTVLTSEAPFIPLASFLCVSVWDQCHIHDLANLQERRIELGHNEVPASSAQALIVQCYSDLRRCCRCSDSGHGKSDQQEGKEAKLAKFHFQRQQQRMLIVGYVRHVHLGAGKTHKMITRALKPPVFEIPDFLTKEECEHIIRKATETGLALSEVKLPDEEITTDKFASDCYDDEYRCLKWAKSGECNNNPEYMLKKCRQSCDVCQDERKYDFEHWDLDKDGVLTGYEFIKAAEMLFFMYLDEYDVFEMFNDLNIKQFGSGEICDDNEASCLQLSKRGACDAYPTWMLLTCRKSCGNCGCEDLAANCSSLAKEEKCLHDDHVNWMLRNCQRSCKVCLGAINNDTYKKMNTNEIFKYMKTLARMHPRHRSRYSYTAYLHSTIPDPVQNRMIDKIETLTKLPRVIVEGSESLQVVKYDKYGHYHAHYDSSSTGDVNLICCHQTRNKSKPCRLCRMVTILYYLNDVEEGGETAFIVADNSTLNASMLISKRGKEGDPFNLSNYCHEANLVIAPKRGTAIMWYNHFLDSDGEWLGERDPYTLHGGCDVRRGNKWIANHWITAPYKSNQHLPSIYRRGKR